MPRKWKDLLTDKSIPDDFAISVNGETLTFGQMREYDREHEGELTQRLTAKESELAKREKTITDASVGMATMLERVSAATGMSTDDLLEGKMPTKKVVAASADLDENDPLVGKLVKEIKGLRSEFAGKVDELRKNAIGPMLNTYLDDFYEDRWDSKIAPSLPEGSKLTLKEALDHANKNGIKDGKGRFDLARAAKELTYDERVAADAKKLAAVERKKMEDEAALASVPRPSSLGQRVKPAKTLLNDKGQVKNFDDVLNDAVNDADLWKGIAQA